MQVGKYQLVRKLASGGMAEVFLAKAAGPMGFEKTLVLKRILPHLAEDPAFVEMFLGEARLAAQLEHPNIVQIFDFGEADGSYFLAMEFIDGPTLRRLVKRAVEQPLPPMMCAKLVSLAAEGLAFAHDFCDAATGAPLGLIHRDVSPDNILVSRQGAVKVVDFGVAKVAGQGHRTQTGVVKGKVAYMPPEQLRALSVDKRVDVYALGVVLYELLTGKRPFDATTEASTMQAILFEPFIPAVERRADIPVALQKILDLALAKERDARYPDCRALQADLERFLLTSGESVGAYQLSQFVAKLMAEGLSGPVVLSPAPVPPVAGATPVKPQSTPKSMAAPPPPPVDSTSPTTPMPVSVRGVMEEARPRAPAQDGSQGAEAPARAAKAAGARRKPAPRALMPSQEGMAAQARGAGEGWNPSRIAGVQASAASSEGAEQDIEERVPTNAGGADDDAVATGAQVRAPKVGRGSAGLLAVLVGGAVLAVGGVALVATRGEQPRVVVPPPLPLAKKPDAKRPPTMEPVVEPSKPPPAPERGVGGDEPAVVTRVPPVVEVKKEDPPVVAPVPSSEGVAEKPVAKVSTPAEPAVKGTAARPRVPVKVVATGMVEFRIRPFATVYVDGQWKGETPMDAVELAAGTRTIRLVNKDLKREETFAFVVKAGQPNTVKFNFHAE